MTQEQSEASNGSSVLYTKESPSKKCPTFAHKKQKVLYKKKSHKMSTTKQQIANGLSRAASYSVRKGEVA